MCVFFPTLAYYYPWSCYIQSRLQLESDPRRLSISIFSIIDHLSLPYLRDIKGLLIINHFRPTCRHYCLISTFLKAIVFSKRIGATATPKAHQNHKHWNFILDVFSCWMSCIWAFGTSHPTNNLHKWSTTFSTKAEKFHLGSDKCSCGGWGGQQTY